jgi:hypothetical protein
MEAYAWDEVAGPAPAGWWETVESIAARFAVPGAGARHVELFESVG